MLITAQLFFSQSLNTFLNISAIKALYSVRCLLLQNPFHITIAFKLIIIGINNTAFGFDKRLKHTFGQFMDLIAFQIHSQSVVLNITESFGRKTTCGLIVATQKYEHKSVMFSILRVIEIKAIVIQL